MSNDYHFYENLFVNKCHNEKLEELEVEFRAYINSELHDNENINAFEFWQRSLQDYLIFSRIAINCLCIVTNSFDAERSFSKLRAIKNPKRCEMNTETLSMEMIMYFNGNVEDILNYLLLD